MKTTSCISLLLLGVGTLFLAQSLLGQDINRLEQKARRAYYFNNFKKAADFYQRLDSLEKGKNPQYQYKLAVCYLKTNANKTKSIQYLEELKNIEDKIGPDYHYWLGRGYHFDYQFDKAMKQYGQFLKDAEKDKKEKKRKEAERNIQMCRNGKKLMKDTVDVRIENLGPTVNTKYAEYSPMVSADESYLIFTSKRKGNVGGRQTEAGQKDSIYGQYFEDIYVSINIGGEWKKPVSIGQTINTEVHDAAVGFAPDGNKLFIYRSDTVRWGNIFASKSVFKWQEPKKLPSPINSEYWEGGASVTTDKNTLYFASNRPGGEGGRDIYVIKRHVVFDEEGSLKSVKWGEVKNLSDKINTPHDDMLPYIHPDGQTLYFASEGHNSMGGFDVFVSKKKGGEWTKPKNLGYPINTPTDNAHFHLSGKGERGYYASATLDGYGNLDLYTLHFPEDFPHSPEAIGLVKGKVEAKGFQAANFKLPDSTTITVYDKENEDTVSVYMPNAKTGEYMITAQKGSKYEMTVKAPGYGQYKKELILKGEKDYFPLKGLNIVLKEDSQVAKPYDPRQKKKMKDTLIADKDTEEQKATPRDTAVQRDQPPSKLSSSLSMIHFGLDKSTITKAARTKLDSLARLLDQHPNLKLKLVGHTDSLGPKVYNQSLSKKRAVSAQNYLVRKGIDKNRLTIDYKGEAEPVAPNNTAKGRAQNRRTQFHILR